VLKPLSPIEPISLVGVPAEQRAVVGHVIAAVRLEMRAAMEGIKLELRAVVNDNAVLRENLSLLNKAVGEFREREAMPLRDALQDFNTNSASRVIENQAKLEILIQSFEQALEKAHISIPEDVARQIRDGRFEEHEHAVDGPDNFGLRKPGDPIL